MAKESAQINRKTENQGTGEIIWKHCDGVPGHRVSRDGGIDVIRNSTCGAINRVQANSRTA